MSRSATVPGPVRRLLRERGRLAAVVLVAVSCLAVAGIQGGAAAALRASLDENWRGAYDILVVPANATGAIDGMLPPNSLASGTTGLTFDDLDAVRATDGVGIAAPIGEIIVPALKSNYPAVAIPPGLIDATTPQAYRLTVTYTTDDGLGERIVASSSSDIVIDESGRPDTTTRCAPGGESYFEDLRVDPDLYPALTRAMSCHPTDTVGVYRAYPDGWGFQNAQNGIYSVQLSGAPQGASRITLIDPVSEKALLGDAGDFLDPLIAFAPDAAVTTAEMLRWAQSDAGPYGTAYLDDQLEASGIVDWLGEDGLADLRRLYADAGRDFDAESAAQASGGSYLPLLVSDATGAELSAKVTVEAFGNAPYDAATTSTLPYAIPETMTTGAHGTVVGTVVADLSGSLNPLVNERALIAWPGADLATAEQLPDFESLSLPAVARPVDARYLTSGGSITLVPSGYRSPLVDPLAQGAEPFALEADPTRAGTEAAYVGLEEKHLQGDGTPTLAVPIGSFSVEGVDASDAADYVPLGAYAPVGTTLTSGPQAGAEIAPSVSGLGLVSPQTIAIGSLASAAAWGDEAPISAIRVRVAGVTGYTPEAQQRVVDVATRLQALGYRAVIVAGSSPSPVDVQVDGYAFGVDAIDDAQELGALGQVTQRWSELGAAARAELAISEATLTIALIGVGSSIVLLGAIQLVGIARRREEAATLRELGFTSARTARWFAAEELPGVLVIAGVAVVAILVAGSALTAIILAAVVAVSLVLGGISVAVGSRPRTTRAPRARRSRRTGARSVGSFGVRQSWLHPVTSITQLVAVVIVGAAAAALLAVFLRSRVEAGSSILAGLLGDQQFLPQLALGITAIVAGVSLALLGRRLELARRAAQWSALRTSGWTGRQIARAQRTESLAIIVPSLLLAIAAVAVGARMLEVPDPWLLTAAAGIAALITALTTLSARTRGTRP